MKSKISKLSAVIAIALSAGSISAQAENYQTFTELSYGDFDQSYYTLGAKYYFDAIENHGPLDEFDYILAESNIYANYFDTDGVSSYILGGEAFLGQFLLGAQRVDTDLGSESFYLDTFSIGYLINKDLLVRANYVMPEAGDNSTQLELRYNHRLSGDDYLGTDISYINDGKVLSLSSKYFTQLEGSRYFAFGLGLASADNVSTQYSLQGDYYFDTMTSLGASYAKGGDYGLNFKRFFNKNMALEVSYNNSNDLDQDQWEISLLGSF